MSEACVVMTTVADEQQARALATAVIEARLAACAQTMQVSSCYRWDGQVVIDNEFLNLFQTVPNQYDALVATILNLHS